MPGLPAVGTLEYNGYVFDGSSHVEVTVEQVKDEAGRTITHQQHTIRVTATIAPGGDLASDPSLEEIRARLGVQGAKLRFINRGFGADLVVGPNETVKDIKCGLAPREMSWKPIGSNKAAEIVWQIVVCTPPQGTGIRTTGIKALNYGMTFEVDKHGDTTRTIEGYIEVVVSRNGRAVSDSADNHMHQFVAVDLPGFERTVTRNVSKDRSRVNFTIVDKQIPSRNPYPAYVTAISGTHRTRWARGRNGMTFYNTISMEITPAANVPPGLAWRIFTDLVAQRTAFAKNAEPKRGVLLDEVEVEEDLFGRPCSFSVRYRVLSCLPDFLAHTGLWQPIGTNWNQWRASLSAITRYRGTADLGADADVIIDLGAGENYESMPKELEEPHLPTVSPIDTTSLANVPPPLNVSWLEYRNDLIPGYSKPVVRQQIIQEPTPASAQSSAVTEFEFPPLGPEKHPDILQEGGEPSYWVRMVGRGIRAGHAIEKQELVKFGSATLQAGTIKDVDARFAMRTIGNYLGVPVYEAAWNILYALTRSPETINDNKGNPKECVLDNGSAHQPDPNSAPI